MKLDSQDVDVIEEIENGLDDKDIPIRDWAPWAITKLIGIIKKLAPDKSEPPKYELKEFVFVDGRLFDGQVIFDRFKGVGWDSGRTASVSLSPSPPPESDVILVDMDFGRIRRCFLLDVEGRKEWHAEDCRRNFRSHVKVEQLTPARESLLK